MSLDLDPFEVENWEQYARACKDAGEIWRFRKALSDFIYFTNAPCYKEIKEYANRRAGEFFDEDIRKQMAKVRLVKELYLESLRQEKIRKAEEEISNARQPRT